MQDLYQRHFRYEADSGKLYHVTSKGTCKAGQEVTALDTKGYVRVQFQGKKILGHRLAWELYYGETPPKYIDHIDGDKTNNRINNLRAATYSENQWNRPATSLNTSGIKGVHKCHGGYQATIAKHGKTYTKWSKSLDTVTQWLDSKRQELHKGFSCN